MTRSNIHNFLLTVRTEVELQNLSKLIDTSYGLLETGCTVPLANVTMQGGGSG